MALNQLTVKMATFACLEVLSLTEEESRSVEEVFGELYAVINSIDMMLMSSAGHWVTLTQVCIVILMLYMSLSDLSMLAEK